MSVSRRGLLGILIGGVGVATQTEASTEGVGVPAGGPPKEPLPMRFDFEPVSSCGCDVCLSAVGHALGTLEYDSRIAPAPLLVVHSSEYWRAIAIARELGLDVWATPQIPNVDTWLVSWRGRRVGSAGAY